MRWLSENLNIIGAVFSKIFHNLDSNQIDIQILVNQERVTNNFLYFTSKIKKQCNK